MFSADPAAETTACPVQLAAVVAPGAPAVVLADGVVTYADLDARAAGTARRLASLGVGEGARVALYAPPDEDLIAVLVALWRLGAVACPLSLRRPPSGLAPLVERLGTSLLLTGDAFDGPDAAPPALPLREVVGAAPGGGPRVSASLRLAAPATVVFTSGSTGRPKAAVHTWANHYYSALGAADNLPLGPGDGWLLSLPLYHVGGLAILVRCFAAGAAVVLPAGGPLDDDVRRPGVTHVSMVTTQLQRLLAAWPEGEPLPLRAILLGGSAMPPGLVRAARARRWPVHTSYGLTEMASQVTATPPGATAAQLGTSGRVLPHRALRVADDGEILVGGATLFAGYLEGGAVVRPGADGWFPTGDRGRLDADGFLHVEGRTDHLFISGGENVQPEEIEAALGRIDGVERAVVVPVPDADFGFRPVAFLQGAAPPPPADIHRQLQRVLPRFMIPRTFLPWPDEAEAGLKVDRRALAARAAQRLGG